MNIKIQLLILLTSVFLCAPGESPFAAGQVDSAKIDRRSYYLGGIATWAEVVNIGIKKMALSAAMSAEEMDELMDEANRIAKKSKVRIYRESDFLVTDLFPVAVTENKHVLVIYRGSTLAEYQALKKRKSRLLAARHYTDETRREIAWALGKLLSYPDAKINQLLSENANNP